MTDHPIITDRLILRPFGAEDVPAVVASLNDLRVSRWLAVIPHPFTEADCRITSPDGRSRWPDLMAVEKDGAVVGCVGTIPHFGYWFAPEVWGQGIGTEAARAALDHVFEVQNRTEIGSGYFIGNDASCAILTKLGFTETKLSKEHCAARKDSFDHMSMHITRAEWEAAR